MNVTTLSKRSEWWLILAIGCLWGLAESCGRMVLHGVGVTHHNGSILAGFSVLLFATAFAMSPRWWIFAILPAVAGVFKMYVAGLEHQPVFCLGNHALYAYFGEAATFGVVVYLSKSSHRTSWLGGALMGATSTLIVAVVFILTPLASGHAVCVVPGTAFPSSIAGLPYSMTVAAIAAPIGFHLGELALRFMRGPEGKTPARLWPVGASIAVACVLTVTFAYVRPSF
jgi:hypothetical protein